VDLKRRVFCAEEEGLKNSHKDPRLGRIERTGKQFARDREGNWKKKVTKKKSCSQAFPMYRTYIERGEGGKGREGEKENAGSMILRNIKPKRKMGSDQEIPESGGRTGNFWHFS